MHLTILFCLFIFCCKTSLSQTPSMDQMRTQMQQQIQNQITNSENQLADAKKNNAPAEKIKELEQKTKAMKVALATFNQYNPPQTKTTFKGDAGAKWTGFVSAVKKSSTELPLPVSTREANIDLSFNETIPTLHRDFNENEELNFTDDKGIGSVTDHGEITVGTEHYTCGCTGVGPAELHEVVVNLFDSTYTIQAFAPTCTGGNSTDGSCGMTWDISIPDEPLKNSRVLSGTRTVKIDANGTKGVVTMTWYLVRTVDVELIVKPRNYNNWVPEPGKDEETVGKIMTVDLVLQGKNGKPTTHKATSFEIRLNNTSKEPGITINYPTKPPSPAALDLQLRQHPNAKLENENQLLKIECDHCTGTSFQIGAFDGGGYTDLTVVAVLDDKSRITGHLLVSDGVTEIPIPKRDAGSKIAKAWASANGNPADTDDKELGDKLKEGGNSHPGDGLTAYEEYRGVISEGKFGRLDPKKQELGVRMKQAEISLFTGGFSLFESASGIKVIRFFENEIGNDRRLNKNSKTAHDYDQCVLKIEKGNLPDSNLGKTYPDPPVLPVNARLIIINLDHLPASYLFWQTNARYLRQQMPFTLKEYIAQTVAHELCHGVNGIHHGNEKSVKAADMQKIFDEKGIKYRIIAYDGTEVPTNTPIKGYVGKEGNMESGDLSCIMCYQPYNLWSITVKDDVAIIHMIPNIYPLGVTLCKLAKGTGINEKDNNNQNDFFGDGTSGNCLGRIQLR